jgi:hypothetical protein
MAEFRRRMFGSANEVWHWRPECSSWPTDWYEVLDSLPDEYPVCPECANADTDVMLEWPLQPE